MTTERKAKYKLEYSNQFWTLSVKQPIGLFERLDNFLSWGEMPRSYYWEVIGHYKTQEEALLAKAEHSQPDSNQAEVYYFND